jgi:phage anti-repressor protein
MAETLALVPVFTGTLNDQSVQLCDARTLHTFMEVLRDFSNWIKGRIKKFKFVEGVDFLSISRSPELASGNRGAAIDYHLTLDMAKELAMVENNDKGREARRYFIACEKQVQLSSIPCKLPYDRISPAQKQHLKELVDLIVASGKQDYPSTWTRFQRKMGCNKYELLHPSKFADAVAYLQGKLDDQSIATLIQKHLPNEVPTLPAPDTPTNQDKIYQALEASNQVAAKVQETMFKTLLQAGKSWRNERWLLSFMADGRDDTVVKPHAEQLETDAIAMPVQKLAVAIGREGDMLVSNHELAILAAACNSRLAQRMQRITN